jgi:hypothetical protein
MPAYIKGVESSFGMYDNADCIWWYLKALFEYIDYTEDYNIIG